MPATENLSPETGRHSTVVRPTPFLILIAAALGSVGLMLHAGARNPSWILMVLFSLWVLSPFAGLGLIALAARRRPMVSGKVLHGLMVGISLGSLALYAQRALGPPRAQAAFIFVVVPPVSWLLIAIAVGFSLAAGRRAGRHP
jgi:hypothetical protein